MAIHAIARPAEEMAMIVLDLFVPMAGEAVGLGVRFSGDDISHRLGAIETGQASGVVTGVTGISVGIQNLGPAVGLMAVRARLGGISIGQVFWINGGVQGHGVGVGVP